MTVGFCGVWLYLKTLIGCELPDFWLLDVLIDEVEALGAIHHAVAPPGFLSTFGVLNAVKPIATSLTIASRFVVFKILVTQILSPQFLGVLFYVLLRGVWVDDVVPSLSSRISLKFIFICIQSLPEVLVSLSLCSKFGHLLILLLLSNGLNISVRHFRDFSFHKSRGLPRLFFLNKLLRLWFNYWRVCEAFGSIRHRIIVLVQQLRLPTLNPLVRLQLGRWLRPHMVAQISIFVCWPIVTSHCCQRFSTRLLVVSLDLCQFWLGSRSMLHIISTARVSGRWAESACGLEFFSHLEILVRRTHIILQHFLLSFCLLLYR